MNYDIFKRVVLEKLPQYLPERLKECNVTIETRENVNRVTDRLVLRENGNNIGLSFCLNDLYERYKGRGDLQGTIKEMADIASAFKPNEVEFNLDAVELKDKIVFQLINTEQNKEFLKKLPHREWEDLSIIYRVVASIDEEGVRSGIIYNDMAERYGLQEEELYNLAYQNTQKLFPPTVHSMNSIMKKLFVEMGETEEMAKMLCEEMPGSETLFVVGNDRKMNGAVSILYEEKLHELAEKMNSDLYVLPSSIHETIAIPTAKGTIDELKEMVEMVNKKEVALQERLSNEVYCYDKELRELRKVTDSKTKRFDDGMVAEPTLPYANGEVRR